MYEWYTPLRGVHSRGDSAPIYRVLHSLQLWLAWPICCKSHPVNHHVELPDTDVKQYAGCHDTERGLLHVSTGRHLPRRASGWPLQQLDGGTSLTRCQIVMLACMRARYSMPVSQSLGTAISCCTAKFRRWLLQPLAQILQPLVWLVLRNLRPLQDLFWYKTDFRSTTIQHCIIFLWMFIGWLFFGVCWISCSVMVQQHVRCNTCRASQGGNKWPPY